MGGTQVFVSEELTTGLLTQPYFDESPPCLLVENLGWEPSSRGSGLLPGDRIVAIDGVPLARQANGAAQPMLIGQYLEYQHCMSFSTVRREATDYVLNNGYEKAKQYRAEAVKAMEDWHNAQSTDGLKANVRTFTAKADDALTYWVEFMRKVHQAFIDKYKGILVDSISNETIDALADRPFYEQWANGIDRLDLDQQLQRLYAGLYEIQGNVDRAFGIGSRASSAHRRPRRCRKRSGPWMPHAAALRPRSPRPRHVPRRRSPSRPLVRSVTCLALR